MGKYIEVENPLQDTYLRVRASGILDKLSEIGLPSLEEVSYMENTMINELTLLYSVNELYKRVVYHTISLTV